MSYGSQKEEEVVYMTKIDLMHKLTWLKNQSYPRGDLSITTKKIYWKKWETIFEDLNNELKNKGER